MDATSTFVGFLAGVVLTGMALGAVGWVVIAEYGRRSRAESAPVAPPAPDLTALTTALIESNAQIMGDLVLRGLEAVTNQVERAAFGQSPAESGENPPPETATAEQQAAWNGPPWGEWPDQEEVAEETDGNIAEWMSLAGPRAVGVAKLPDFTGETME